MILLIASFTLNPFLKKKASSNVSSNEFIVIYQVMALILVLAYIIYLLKYKNCSLSCFNKLSRNDLLWTIMAVITGISGSILLLTLIKRDEISYIIPNVQAIVILLGGLIGYFLFNESINKYKISGMILIFFGIIILNYGKLKRH